MNGFRLGSVLGIEIRIDPSWFIIFFLILWTFSVGVFPAALPGASTVVHFAMGAIGTLLFFASLLAHELSHSVVARRKGMEVEGITLFIFGGMARTRMEFRRAEDEFQVAGIGPVSSLVIGAMFWAIARVGGVLDAPEGVTIVASYLAFLNVALAVFNMLPGFPLDGGRIFRSLVWKQTGDLTRATRWASNGGKAIGYMLMGIGLLNFFAANLVGGLWMVLIGWFVRSAAESSLAQHRVREAFRGISARDVMTPDPVTVDPDLRLDRFVEDHILRGRHQSYPVTVDGRALGLITLERVKAVPREEWGVLTVQDAMVEAADGVVVRPEEPMLEVIDRLGGSRVRRVLVVDRGELMGIITQTDLARCLERARILDE
jgi:Zn-dependent protease/predicted transcriptional regulator